MGTYTSPTHSQGQEENRCTHAYYPTHFVYSFIVQVTNPGNVTTRSGLVLPTLVNSMKGGKKPSLACMPAAQPDLGNASMRLHAWVILGYVSPTKQ